MERLLGPAKPVSDVLASLDRQYSEQGKSGVYFLKPHELIAPHLDELLKPTGDSLNGQGVLAFRGSAYADAVVFFDAALELMGDQPAEVQSKLTARMNRAAAIREMGLIIQSRDELVRMLPELDQTSAQDSKTNGRARYNLALCQWQLGDRASAQRSAEASLAAYDAGPKADQVDLALRGQSEDLLATVKAGKAPPPIAAIDVPAALEAARNRYRPAQAPRSSPLTRSLLPCWTKFLAQPGRPSRSSTHSTDTTTSKGSPQSGSCR